MPITGLHALLYSANAAELRAFFRDTLRFPFTDVGEGWLIFDVPSADLGVHPECPEPEKRHNTHNVSFFCDDIQATVSELKARGVEFIHEVENHGYGLVTHFKAPGGLVLQLYQPLYLKHPE